MEVPAADTTSLAGRSVIVTGGSGFIGTNLIVALGAVGADVSNLDTVPPRRAGAPGRYQEVDILDRGRLTSVLEEIRPQVVFHLAARTDLQGGPSGYEANRAGVANLVAALETVESVERLLFASSQLVCRLGYQPEHDTDYAPSSDYGRSKVEGEQIVREWASSRIAWTITRPTSIWGPWFGQPYRPFFEAVLGGRFVLPRSLDATRSFGYVGNIVHQYLALASTAADLVDGRTFYLADYEAVKLREWADLIRLAAGRRAIREVPDWLMTSIARLGDGAQKLGWKTPPLTSSRLRNMMTSSVVDTAPIRQIAGALPYTVNDGISATLEWLRQAQS